MMWTRRKLLQAGGMTAAGLLLARPARSLPVDPDTLDGGDVRALALRALDAARDAGARYADVRFTREHQRSPVVSIDRDERLSESERLNVGVRALVGNGWGFAASPVWSATEVARLGREAAAQAKLRVSGIAPLVDLGPPPPVRNGRWSTPIRIDPLLMSVDEVFDYMQGLAIFTSQTAGAKLMMQCGFTRFDTTFASSEGASFEQSTYDTSAQLTLLYGSQAKHVSATGATKIAAGAGWELIADAPLRETITQLIETMIADAALPIVPVDAGRYPVVFDAETMARMLDVSIGAATDLDRAIGDEANASGTSYLNDPLAMLGNYMTGSDALTVTANRTMSRGVATVRWDDEGIEPDEWTLVNCGVLTDFQTTRESSHWLAPYYERTGRPTRSHGCANGASASYLPIGATPNLIMAPSVTTTTFDDLVRGVDRGIAMTEGTVIMDSQALNGMGFGAAYDIRRGKRVARLANAGFSIRAPDVWKTLHATGGGASVRTVALSRWKGEPGQSVKHSVSAVPGLCSAVAVYDNARRA